MGDVPHERAPKAQFGPDRRLVLLSGVATLIAVALALFTSDTTQRLFAGVAALVLAAHTIIDLIFWPRLTVTPEGLLLRTPTARARLAWSDQPIVRIDERSRLGLASHTLEIDADPLLVVLSRRALGADPSDVLALIDAFRPGRPDAD
jgi:hypothetical protein